ncbi:hypothetical protein GJAV_G00140820 [Gymnothorax javanicus]|nr:hypothetical protein GJAV_G00140820 [Gymnothorax javanicus]
MQGVEVRNLEFSAGMELYVYGLVHPNATRFGVNVGHSMEELAIHIDPRINHIGDVRTIVLNSKESNQWQQEERSKSFPFEAGQPFWMTVHFNYDTFDIYLANGDKVQFTNRRKEMKYTFLFFHGDATIQEICVRPSNITCSKCSTYTSY